MKPNYKKNQHGAALAVSLILLVTMTILGVATLNGTRLAEKVSSNAQQKAIVYETAESVIYAIRGSADFEQRLEMAVNSKVAPPPIPQNIETAEIAVELDQTNALGTSVDVDAVAEIQFCESMPREGNELGDVIDNRPPIGYQYDIRATSTIENTRARADHVLRIEVGGPDVGLVGSCIAPGQTAQP